MAYALDIGQCSMWQQGSVHPLTHHTVAELDSAIAQKHGEVHRWICRVKLEVGSASCWLRKDSPLQHINSRSHLAAQRTPSAPVLNLTIPAAALVTSGPLTHA
jgi:hypothetical protein